MRDSVSPPSLHRRRIICIGYNLTIIIIVGLMCAIWREIGRYGDEGSRKMDNIMFILNLNGFLIGIVRKLQNTVVTVH